MHLIVDPRKVSNGWALTHSAELVVDGSVAQADPTLIGTEIGDRDATQVSANS